MKLDRIYTRSGDDGGAARRLVTGTLSSIPLPLGSLYSVQGSGAAQRR
jgi:hypothetical protein